MSRHLPRSGLLVGAACVIAGQLCGALPLRAQEVNALTRAEFQRALQERDALIIELLRRVEELEYTRASAPNGPSPPLSPLPVAKPVPPGVPPTATVAVEPPATPEPPAPEGQQRAQAEPQAPGQVEIDEEAATRALEVTLVQEGALLLPAGRAEFTPSFTYTRRTGDFPNVVTQNGTQFVGEQEVRRNELQFLGSLLVGLPFDSQLELGLPYNLVDQSTVIAVAGIPRQKFSDTGHGLGDLSVGLAKTVLREKRWWPDVVMRATWDTGTGTKDNNDVVLDGGFQELTGSISLAKRQDPLVFVGGASYQAAFEDDDIEPGNTLGFSLGTFLAASPNTSLRVVLNQSFIDEFKVDGDKISGSDQVQGILTFGASAILGRNVLLDVAVGVGLTDDSPDYSVSLSLPIRFTVPGF